MENIFFELSNGSKNGPNGKQISYVTGMDQKELTVQNLQW